MDFFPQLNEQAVLRGKQKVPEHCLKLERWQGPPHVNKVKQHETVSSVSRSVYLFSLFSLFRY